MNFQNDWSDAMILQIASIGKMNNDWMIRVSDLSLDLKKDGRWNGLMDVDIAR